MDDDTEYNDSGDEDEPRIPLPLIFNEAEWGLIGRISDYIDNSLEKLLMEQQNKKQKIIDNNDHKSPSKNYNGIMENIEAF